MVVPQMTLFGLNAFAVRQVYVNLLVLFFRKAVYWPNQLCVDPFDIWITLEKKKQDVICVSPNAILLLSYGLL